MQSSRPIMKLLTPFSSILVFVLLTGCGTSSPSFLQIEKLQVDIDRDGQEETITLELEDGIDSLKFTRVTVTMGNGKTASFDNLDGWDEYRDYDAKYNFEKSNFS